MENGIYHISSIQRCVFFSNFNISEIRLLLKVKSYDRVSMAVVWLRFVIPKVLKVFVSPPSSMDIT